MQRENYCMISAAIKTRKKWGRNLYKVKKHISRLPHSIARPSSMFSCILSNQALRKII